ncbi:hypothetical protein LAZ67_3001419 [Cordylochernes scorpioides]|uniref:Integrase catalytic domain-containing protein n=1 Tax=Cordylochernes scorpioides TaxID=51811 RepID=A0ABY6KA79_9ARAC|nr:hypothetical protein LAZ67_3001419 [Cordylochernes scorpioides]
MAYNKHSDSLAQPTPGKIKMKKRSLNTRREIATTSGFMHSDISPTLHEKFKCIFCDNGHPSQDCRKGMKMGMEQKNEKIESYKRCFKYLLPGHRSRQCKRKVRCDFCKRDGHYAIMCRGADHAESKRKSPQRPQNSTPTPGSSDAATVNEMSNCVSTKACLETLLVKVWSPKGSKVVQAVIDSGSSQSYILEHIVKDLGVPIMGEEELDHEIFGGIRYTDRHRIYCLTLSSIENDRCISCPASATNQIARCIRKPTFGSWARELASKKIQLSAFKAESDVVELLLGADINPKIATANMIRLSDDLITRETLLGWVVQGKTEGKFPDKNPNQVHNSMLITSLMTQEIKVSDLWSLENIGVMDDGQAESNTTPVRPVFDASCKTKGGWSLNDCLAKGPNLLELIPDIMLRFRLNKIGVIADIEKAFLQISVAKEDRQFLRFLWWENGKQENLGFHQHKRVVFGVTSSPFLLATTLKLHLEQYERELIPLLKCMYMDNCVNSVNSLEEAQVSQQQSIDLLSPAGFNLRQWQMGGPGIVNSENISVLGMKWDTADDTLTISDKLMMTQTYKSLDRENDVKIEIQTHKLTKRIMLSEAHAVFGPLGLFSPFTIVPKIILQQCVKSELKWDQPVSEDIEKKFVEWQSQITELLSARIPRLTKQVMKIISESIAKPETNIWFWTDSSTALRWIQNEKPVKKLIEHKWWEEPSFLWGEESSWNQFDPIFDEEEINKELKKTVNIAVNSTKDNFIDKLERYGDYHRIVRIVAYLLRFKRKTVSDQSRPGQHDKMSKEISVKEFEEAEKVVLQHIQLISFGRDDKRINKLNAFTDEYELYQIKSQLYFGVDDYDTRCPIVLPGENQVVKLLIRKEHEMISHAGIQTTQRLTESILILATRIGSTPAFVVISVDLAGPLTESGGKKIWVVLYTCAVYRAVHLELTKTVSTERFLDTFRRFVARRVRPSILYSDNGLIFVGCNNLFKKVNWNDVLRYATVQHIKWNFYPPTAAFWGGWWERLVGLMKQLIRKVLGDKTVSYKELQTVICEMESAMNSRPLTAISEESGLIPITPAKFMCDNVSCLFVPEADIVDSKFLKESHGKGFLRQNTRNKTKSIKEGDVVLIEVDNKRRTEWPIGVIEKTYPGKDGIVRVAMIKTKRGNFLRPVQRLFFLESSENYSKEDFGKGRDLEKEKKINLDTPSISQRSIRGKDSPVITRSGRIVKPPDRY